MDGERARRSTLNETAKVKPEPLVSRGENSVRGFQTDEKFGIASTGVVRCVWENLGATDSGSIFGSDRGAELKTAARIHSPRSSLTGFVPNRLNPERQIVNEPDARALLRRRYSQVLDTTSRGLTLHADGRRAIEDEEA